LFCTFLTFVRDVDFLFYFVNLAAASPWFRRSWSPNYSVLVYKVVVFVKEMPHHLRGQFNSAGCTR
jgi:hypothetical protein